MRNEIEEILRAVGTCGSTELHFISVCCTSPTLLAFEPEKTFPVFALRIGREVDLQKTWQRLCELYELMPGRVAQPIALKRLSNNRWILVQSGLPGIPWFALASCIKHRILAVDVIDRSIETLQTFQAAVQSRTKFRKNCAPSEPFFELLEKVNSARLGIDASTLKSLEDFGRILETLGTLDCDWQHGDFCVNNLIFDEQLTYLIDFDEFGDTCTPLHDAVGLAFSLSEYLQEAEFWNILKRCIRETPYHTFDRTQVHALVLNHLLYCLQKTIGVVRRKKRQGELMAVIQTVLLHFSQNPACFKDKTSFDVKAC